MKAAPTDWLLEENNPSAGYFALRDIPGEPENSLEVEQTKASIMADGAVPKILEKQNASGYWEIAQAFYIRAKYRTPYGLLSYWLS